MPGINPNAANCRSQVHLTIERRVRFMIVKVGDSLGETFGNFVGRLATTPAVLTLVIAAVDSIRNLGQKDWAAVMPHRHPLSTTSRNGYLANHTGYHSM